MIENIKFLDGTIIKASIGFSGNLCTVVATDLPEDTSYIELVTDGGAVYGKYSGFSTVYRVTEHSTILSNDGSVWTEPVIEEMPEMIINAEPSLEERVADLEDATVELFEMLIGEEE